MPNAEVDMEYPRQGTGWWRLLASVVGIGVSGCGVYSLPQQRYVAIDVSPRSDQIVFVGAGLGATDLYLLHLPTRKVTRIAQTLKYEQDPVFSPDGESVVYAASASSDEPAHIFLCSLDGKHSRRLTKDDQYSDSMPSFSRDGSQITFV